MVNKRWVPLGHHHTLTGRTCQTISTNSATKTSLHSEINSWESKVRLRDRKWCVLRSTLFHNKFQNTPEAMVCQYEIWDVFGRLLQSALPSLMSLMA